jgi:hypothetical protein
MLKPLKISEAIVAQTVYRDVPAVTVETLFHIHK